MGFIWMPDHKCDLPMPTQKYKLDTVWQCDYCKLYYRMIPTFSPDRNRSMLSEMWLKIEEDWLYVNLPPDSIKYDFILDKECTDFSKPFIEGNLPDKDEY